MPRAFVLLDRIDTPEGPLELRKRGERDFMISIAGRVLMTSNLHRSELLLAELGCQPIRDRAAPRVLIGGLGLGYTLRAALDGLGKKARVDVAELNPAVERWCRGPLAVLTGGAANDSRVRVLVGDVSERIRAAAREAGAARYDAIILDLYLGPSDGPRAHLDTLYGPAILRAAHAALTPGGVYAVWAEVPSPSFEARLQEAGFRTELIQNRGGGPRHAIYRAIRSGSVGVARGKRK